MKKKSLWIMVAVVLVMAAVLGACTNGITVATMLDAACFRDGNTAKYTPEMLVTCDGTEVAAYRNGKWEDPYKLGFSQPQFNDNKAVALDLKDSDIKDAKFTADETKGFTAMQAKFANASKSLGVKDAADATIYVRIDTQTKALQEMEIRYSVTRNDRVYQVVVRSQLAA